VFDFWRQVADAGRPELIDVYVDASFVGRSAIMAAGRSGLAAHFSARPERPIAVAIEDPLVAMVAEGDLVVQVRMRQHAHPSRVGDTYTTTLFDMFRLADGRLVEHWDAALKPALAR
jgi:predicted SnoaL-like aldol condensation-catalyzing enzyme